MQKILIDGTETTEKVVNTDNSKVEVIFNGENFQIYGTHNDVVIEKGEAVTYGYYGSTTIFDEAQANVYGNYKDFTQA